MSTISFNKIGFFFLLLIVGSIDAYAQIPVNNNITINSSDNKFKATTNSSLYDGYLSIETQRLGLEANEKTIFANNMSSEFRIIKTAQSDNVTIFDSNDAKLRDNSMEVKVESNNNTSAIYHDYTTNNLQDWSNYNYLNFWFKGQNTGKSITVLLRDPNWKSVNGFRLVDNSTMWKKIQIPLYSTYYNMSMSNIRGLEFHFDKGTKGQFKIDSIQLVSEGKKTLFNDYITTIAKPWKQSNTSSIILSNNDDSIVGVNSLDVKIATNNGTLAIYHDYTTNNLQDWSNYNYLNFWFKGQNTGKTFVIDLRDESWKPLGDFDFTDNSTNWKKIQIPLQNFGTTDFTKVRGLEFLFNQKLNTEFKIDDMFLSITSIEPMIHLDDHTYISSEFIYVLGNVKSTEQGSAVVIRIINPSNNVIKVNQIIPQSDKTFAFPLHLSNDQFNVAGKYNILVQYGLMEHKANTTFTLLIPQLIDTYNGYNVYELNKIFYATLQDQGNFDIDRIITNQYSGILTNNTLDNIKQNIDETLINIQPVVNSLPTVTPMPKHVSNFPISDSMLLEIWGNRTDLQLAYPEVELGNLTGLKIWAKTIGWKVEPNLSALIPKNGVPSYLKENVQIPTQSSGLDQKTIIILQIIAIAIISISIVLGYKFYKSAKRFHDENSD